MPSSEEMLYSVVFRREINHLKLKLNDKKSYVENCMLQWVITYLENRIKEMK
jgi:hypothetical protein